MDLEDFIWSKIKLVVYCWNVTVFMCRMVISESDSISLCLIGWRSSQPACARFYCHTVQDLVVNMTENKWWVLLRKKTNETKNNLKITKSLGSKIKLSYIVWNIAPDSGDNYFFYNAGLRGLIFCAPSYVVTHTHTFWLIMCYTELRSWNYQQGYAVICPATSAVYLLTNSVSFGFSCY